MASPTHSPTPTLDQDQDQDQDQDADVDVASAMGFASFGAKPNPPKKKRKVDKFGSNSEGSGSNNTPLGTRGRKQGGPAPRQKLAQGESEMQGKGKLVEGDGGVRVWEGNVAAGGVDGMGNGEVRDGTLGQGYGLGQQPEFVDAGPAYIIGDEEVRAGYGPREPVMAPRMYAGQWEGVQYPGMGTGGLEAGKRPDGEWNWQALRRGVRDERGDMAFYDASFVEDPWKHMLGAGGQAKPRDGGQG
ncbi:hypothetical protein ABVK25_004551 [Lepraria finkii]|uniref:Uncharacterized protein n=1 Tax=Lepraria finkii TaxID=1340010 RepID=A0ABR4BBJ3_9LECA